MESLVDFEGYIGGWAGDCTGRNLCWLQPSAPARGKVEARQISLTEQYFSTLNSIKSRYIKLFDIAQELNKSRCGVVDEGFALGDGSLAGVASNAVGI